MRNATYELAIPASPTSLSTARATASVVTSFASTAAATVISTVARTTTIATCYLLLPAWPHGPAAIRLHVVLTEPYVLVRAQVELAL